MKTGHLVLADHGSDITVRDDLVSRRITELNPSHNKYDWLGPGAYFFENDHRRALMFANAAQSNPEKRYTKQPIATPAVVGAVLQLDFILDMTTQEGIENYCLAYQAMVEYLTAHGQPEPKNSKASDEDEDIIVRQLDSDVFNFMHRIRRETDQPLFQAVRSAFPQGEAVAPSSAFRRNSHVQIAANAQVQLAHAKANYASRNPRRRVSPVA